MQIILKYLRYLILFPVTVKLNNINITENYKQESHKTSMGQERYSLRSSTKEKSEIPVTSKSIILTG